MGAHKFCFQQLIFFIDVGIFLELSLAITNRTLFRAAHKSLQSIFSVLGTKICNILFIFKLRIKKCIYIIFKQGNALLLRIGCNFYEGFIYDEKLAQTISLNDSNI